MAALQGAAGLIIFTLLAWCLSEKRSAVSVKLILSGIGVQLVLGLILLKIPIFQQVFIALNSVVLALEESTRAGTSMVFGYLGGGPLPFEVKSPGNVFILGFRALPLVLVMSALSSLLFIGGFCRGWCAGLHGA